MPRSTLLAGAMAVVIAVLARGAGSAASSDPRPAPATRPSDGPAEVVNPHWSATGCAHCHEMRDDRPQSIPPERVDAVCLACHDGRKAPMERHPVGRSFKGTGMTPPEGWPAAGGRLGCATCHDIRRSGHRVGGRPKENPFFIRGASANLTAFCGACHTTTAEHRKYNPHAMLKADGTPDAQTCSFCHTQDYSKGIPAVRTRKSGLRGDPITLCLGCHGQHVDYFDPGHIGHPVDAKRRAYLVAAESVPAGAPVPTERQSAAGDTGAWPSRLPLWPDGRIVCSTCHNPHQKGVFPSESILATGAQPPSLWATPENQPMNLPLRGLGKEVCHACHDK